MTAVKRLGYVGALNSALQHEMDRDSSVFVMGEDVGRHGGMFRVTAGLLERFGERRVIDTPISESGFIGLALGAAVMGKRPVVEIMFQDFALVALDQILNQVAKTTYMSGGEVKVPLVLRTQGGGYKGSAAQHSQMLEALFLHLPGLKVVAPSNAADAKGLLSTAIRDDNPVLFLEHKLLYASKEDYPDGEYLVPLGKARVVRPGTNLTLISYSFLVGMALEAAMVLETQGVSAEVIDLRSLNPLDWPTLETSVRKTHRVLIVHEAHARCGVAADLSAQIQERLFDELDAPILRLCARDIPIPFAQVLEEATLPSVDKILAKVRELL